MGAARRRRRWFATNFGHMDPMRRPRYRRRSTIKQAQRLADMIAREKAIQQRKGQRKGKR